MICVGLGAYYAILRLIGMICASCLCCLQFSFIIVTGVYRFRDYGRLCALSKLWTNQTSTDEPADDTWTYAKDGNLILALWIL